VRLSQRQGQKTQNVEETNAAVNEMNRLQENVKGANTEISLLQNHIQKSSRKDALEKYGSGVIRVELELAFPDSPDGPNSMVLEMASLDEMPHAVFIFLEMVDSKLFDGCSFILNAMDIIKAAPLPFDGTSAAAKVKAFTRAGLESVAFREYSPEYPHTKYTVGFAVDGSPSFFINTNDNTAMHEGDPCFAKIVSGFDTVKRLEAAPTRKDGMWYKRRIGLRRASVL
jgi:cyclophilin family peptidyl-prolyl cis-trans isomerase